MPKYRFLRVSVSWPDAEQNIKLNVIEEEDEDPVKISGRDFATLIHMSWDDAVDNPEPNADNQVDFAETIYPDGTRIYVNGKRVSLKRAHRAFEIALEKAIRAGIEAVAERANEPLEA